MLHKQAHLFSSRGINIHSWRRYSSAGAEGHRMRQMSEPERLARLGEDERLGLLLLSSSDSHRSASGAKKYLLQRDEVGSSLSALSDAAASLRVELHFLKSLAMLHALTEEGKEVEWVPDVETALCEPTAVPGFVLFLRRAHALRYARFWMDVQDTFQLSAGKYCQTRCVEIFKSYLAPSELHRPLPVSSAARMKALRVLKRGGSARAAFGAAQAEVRFFLDRCVFPAFQSSDLSDLRMLVPQPLLIASGDGGEMEEDGVRDGDVEEEEEVSAAAVHDEPAVLLPSLRKVLLHAPLLRQLRIFLRQRHCEEYALFWLECEEFRMLLPSAFSAAAARDIYARFLKLGAPQQLPLADEVKAGIVAQLDSPQTDMYVPVQSVVFSFLQRYFHRAFLESDAYLHVNLMPVRQRSRLSRRYPALSRLLRNEMDDSDSDFLLKKFQRDLRREGCEELLLCFNELDDFMEAPATELAIESFLLRRAKRIYSKHFKLGGNLAVEIPSDVKRNIMKQLCEERASPDMFQEAQAAVLARMQEYYIAFCQRDLSSRRKRRSSSIFFAALSRTGGGPHAENEDAFRRSIIPFRHVLHDALARTYYKNYLASTYCEENILFWLEVEEFKMLPKSEFMKVQARKIYDKYVRPGALLEVNLGGDVRRELIARLEAPSPTLFKRAQAAIERLQRVDIYPRFVRTSLFAEMKEALIKRERTEAGLVRKGSVPSITTPLADVPQLSHSLAPGTPYDDLKAVLDDPLGVRYFRKYLQSRFLASSADNKQSQHVSPTNLSFWLAAEALQHIPGEGYLRSQARRIFTSYLKPGAPMEVTIRDEEEIEAAEAELESSVIPRGIMLPMQRRVYDYMAVNCFPTFRDSFLYSELLTERSRQAALRGRRRGSVAF
eukprot:PLAT1885.1.p1 GENE.PLAT1885.1~~PLAT1885.1.p1  ORF type:complete len:890 (+),score=197.41 PLAT1885.1:49-2718(+)